MMGVPFERLHSPEVPEQSGQTNNNTINITDGRHVNISHRLKHKPEWTGFNSTGGTSMDYSSQVDDSLPFPRQLIISEK